MKKLNKEDNKGPSMPVDMNLPRWVCQNCRKNLCIGSADTHTDKFSIDSSSPGSAAMDHSFVVLPNQRSRPHGGITYPGSNQSGKGMEDSFVVLPHTAASVYKSDSGSDGRGTHLSSPNGGIGACMQPNNYGFNSTIVVLKRAFEIATTQTKVEQPICLECTRVLFDKLDNEVEDVNRDIKAYEGCLQHLEGESQNILSEVVFLEEKLKIEEEQRKLEAAIQETEKKCAQVTSELKELESKSSRFEELERQYWNEFNNYQFQLVSHQEESDAILAKIDCSQAHFQSLKPKNVFQDAFPISHEGEFGTINNFRLGRLPKTPIEWDEINAAWGQACILLHTMAQYFHPEFPYQIKILPMGSYPRMMDSSKNIHELYGPVNVLWSSRYDTAMTLYLACLKEFAEFANTQDREKKMRPDQCFKLPYKIEKDKVGSYCIKRSFNQQEMWTKALKYTLCNLKWVRDWFVAYADF